MPVYFIHSIPSVKEVGTEGPRRKFHFFAAPFLIWLYVSFIHVKLCIKEII